MNIVKKSFITLIILACIAFFGCGDTREAQNNPGNENIPHNNDNEAVDEAVILYTPNFEIIDWQGKTFTFLCTDASGYSDYYETIDIYVEASIGEVFNDAVLLRNQVAEDKYNIEIKEIKSSNVRADTERAVRAGDDLYNAIFAITWEGTALAQSGMLLDLNTLPNIDFSQPWWDPNVKNDLSIANKTYFMTGDISVMDDNCTMLFFFNKKLIQDYGLTDPYDLLRGNNWTIDEYAKLVKSVSRDLNGDGIMDQNDQFGNLMAFHYIQYMVQGAGMRYAELDRDGFPQITFMSERTTSAVSKLFDLYFDDTVCMFIQNLNPPGGMNEYTYGRQLFTNDQFLFVLSQPLIFYEFRDMESEFGIMPIPKYDSNQDRYYSPVDTACTFLSVPITVESIDFTGYVLEAFAAESKNIVTPAYYEIMLKRKYTRDEESAEILDLISQSRLYDLGINYNWGGINEIIASSFQRNSTDIASAFERIENRVIQAAERTFEAYLNNEEN